MEDKKLVIQIFSITLILDIITKFIIIATIELYSSIKIIPGLFNIVHVKNTGAAFSMFAHGGIGGRIVLTLVSIGASILIIYLLKKSEHKTERIALSLILSGAVGNLLERLFVGEVTDFLDVYVGSYHWPAFNVADSAITIGAVLMVIMILKESKNDTNKEEKNLKE